MSRLKEFYIRIRYSNGTSKVVPVREAKYDSHIVEFGYASKEEYDLFVK